MKILTNAAYVLLEKQLAYWQAAYERERDRADRLQDNFLQANGIQPSVERPAPPPTAHENLAEQVGELFMDEIGKMELTLEESAEQKRIEAQFANAQLLAEQE